MSSHPIARSVSKSTKRNSGSGVDLVPWWFLGLSFVLFFASLAFDCFYWGDKNPPESFGIGLWILLLGWLGILDGIFAWLANPSLFIAWLMMGFRSTRIVSLIFSIVALLFALSFLLNRDMLKNEAGTRATIVGYGPGYALWLASILVTVLGNLFRIYLPKKERK